MFEVGKVYTFGGDIVRPVFDSVDGDQREYADDGFIMHYKDVDVHYKEKVIRPATEANCVCRSTEPLVFDVDKIESPLVEDYVISDQYNTIRNMLTRLCLGTSDSEIKAIHKVAIPWKDRDVKLTEQAILRELIKYFEDYVGKPYSGTPRGHGIYENDMMNALTVVFGYKVAYAIMQVVEEPMVKVSFVDPGKFIAYYDGQDMREFLRSVEDKLNNRVRVSSNSEQSSANNSTFPKSSFTAALEKMGMD